MPKTAGRRLVSVVGGESTGKSTLVAALVRDLPAVAVPETLRDWVMHKGRVPTAEEQREVMLAHCAAEAQALAQPTPPQWVVSDSGPLMTAVYSIVYYADHSLVAEATSAISDVALVVWCAADIPWEPDGDQRDGPHLRAAAQEIVGEVLRESGMPFLEVRGTVEHRVTRVAEYLATL